MALSRRLCHSRKKQHFEFVATGLWPVRQDNERSTVSADRIRSERAKLEGCKAQRQSCCAKGSSATPAQMGGSSSRRGGDLDVKSLGRTRSYSARRFNPVCAAPFLFASPPKAFGGDPPRFAKKFALTIKCGEHSGNLIAQEKVQRHQPHCVVVYGITRLHSNHRERSATRQKSICRQIGFVFRSGNSDRAEP